MLQFSAMLWTRTSGDFLRSLQQNCAFGLCDLKNVAILLQLRLWDARLILQSYKRVETRAYKKVVVLISFCLFFLYEATSLSRHRLLQHFSIQHAVNVLISFNCQKPHKLGESCQAHGAVPSPWLVSLHSPHLFCDSGRGIACCGFRLALGLLGCDGRCRCCPLLVSLGSCS